MALNTKIIYKGRTFIEQVQDWRKLMRIDFEQGAVIDEDWICSTADADDDMIEDLEYHIAVGTYARVGMNFTPPETLKTNTRDMVTFKPYCARSQKLAALLKNKSNEQTT